jgi:hypothetical protein
MNINLGSDSLRNVATQHQAITAITQHVNATFGAKLEDLRGSMDFIKAICIAIEDIANKHGAKGLDKLELFKSVYLELFPTTSAQEMAQLVGAVNWLCANGHVVPKKKSTVSKVRGFFRKK